MYKVEQAIIVEGKYDKIKLASIVDGLIIQTDGFGIFKNRDMRAMIRKLAETKGIVILTDSDTAGFKIRRYISSFAPVDKIKHAYIPDVSGKEKRKIAPGKEGKIGVEGMPVEVIVKALETAGVLGEKSAADEEKEKLTKYDMYELGLSGRENSFEKRRKVLEKLELPEYISANALLDIVNTLMTAEEFKDMVEKL